LLRDYDLPRILERAVRADADIAEVWQPVAEAFVRIAGNPAAAAGPRSLPMAGANLSTAAPISDPAAIRAALAAELQATREPFGP
jgi:hypothetical protein